MSPLLVYAFPTESQAWIIEDGHLLEPDGFVAPNLFEGQYVRDV